MKVCITSETVYPVIRGGLSEWAHMLVKHLSDVKFDLFCITTPEQTTPVYPKLPNVGKIVIVPTTEGKFNMDCDISPKTSRKLAEVLENTLHGQPLDLEKIILLRDRRAINKGWFRSKRCFDSMCDFYRNNKLDVPFVEYFWTVLGLYAIIIDNIMAASKVPRADVYHAISTGYAGLAGSMAKLIYHSPLVITEQGLFLLERQKELSRQNVSDWYRGQLMKFTESIVKTSYKYADCVVPPCHSHLAVEKRLGLDMDKALVIDNGIEVERFTPGPHRNGSAPVIGCFARVVPIKGLEVLIRAAKIVLQKHLATFVVLGEVQDESYYHECLSLVKELGLENQFKFMGHIETPLEWYHKVDIFTLSSFSEGVPYALLEAMSCGVPSVCTAVGGVPEIISDVAGYVVPPNQPEKLAEKLSELLVDKDLRHKIGQQAIARARQKYTIKQTASRFYELYRELRAAYEKN